MLRLAAIAIAVMALVAMASLVTVVAAHAAASLTPIVATEPAVRIPRVLAAVATTGTQAPALTIVSTPHPTPVTRPRTRVAYPRAS